MAKAARELEQRHNGQQTATAWTQQISQQIMSSVSGSGGTGALSGNMEKRTNASMAMTHNNMGQPKNAGGEKVPVNW